VTTKLQLIKVIIKNTYVITGFIVAIPRVIHIIELGLPQYGTNIQGCW